MMKKIFLIFTLCFLTFPTLASAAEFYFERSGKATESGEEIIVLRLKAQGEKINAVSGIIEIPPSAEILKVNTGSSAILFWIEMPRAGQSIVFSGITPGGFEGDVALFSFAIATKAPGITLKVTDGTVIRNDGLGTNISVTSKSLYTDSTPPKGLIVEEKDVFSPEPFAISVTREENVFDGAYFASFVAQDKKSGVSKYEWAHTWLLSPREGDWREASSTILLSKRIYFERIFIRAVDGEGNTRMEQTVGPYRYAAIIVCVIILISALCVLL